MRARVQALVTADVESGLVMSTDIDSGAKLRPRELSGFQRFHRFSAIPNIYNKPGNLLRSKKQLRRLQQIGFGHSFGTAKEQGRHRPYFAT